ncbi:hypothetical protein AVEN_110643-1 [Araneus ventricosus]|uniref:Uncharacterized protein n=1 Tax=Araneus ventricosus TaxID=182803 RepID=A0A4Y2AVY4_ARAVE|nr:hypothetical protein AVEN_110643-1 [Araneus ventricosus]
MCASIKVPRSGGSNIYCKCSCSMLALQYHLTSEYDVFDQAYLNDSVPSLSTPSLPEISKRCSENTQYTLIIGFSFFLLSTRMMMTRFGVVCKFRHGENDLNIVLVIRLWFEITEFRS